MYLVVSHNVPSYVFFDHSPQNLYLLYITCCILHLLALFNFGCLFFKVVVVFQSTNSNLRVYYFFIELVHGTLSGNYDLLSNVCQFLALNGRVIHHSWFLVPYCRKFISGIKLLGLFDLAFVDHHCELSKQIQINKAVQ